MGLQGFKVRNASGRNTRNLIGYGADRPKPKWPGNARIAVQFVLNYEEGGENCILDGDEGAEMFLSDIVPAPEVKGMRHMSMESLFEYGSRVGVWRILNLFEKQGWPITIFAVASALEKHPQLATHLAQGKHEIAAHGHRWIDHQRMDTSDERAQITKALEVLEQATGNRPEGWYTGRSSPNTLELVANHFDMAYCADDYSDDLPFWDYRYDKPLLIVPYALDTNDMRFASPAGFANSDEFFAYLKDAFDTLYAEGPEQAGMMSVGLHCRLAGRPGRFAGLKKFVDYVASHEDVWVCRRIDIANHWRTHFPAERPA